MNYHHKLVLFTVVFSLICFMFSGCSTGSKSTDKKAPKGIQNSNPAGASQKPQYYDDEKTPELMGGSESKNMIADHSIDLNKNPKLKGVLFYNGPPNIKRVALTFDDGPDTKFTPQILDILHQNGIKATFFIVGRRAQTYPSMVKRIAQEGHAIGNHSWDHPVFSKLNSDKVNTEISQTENLLNSIIGYNPSLFRPPYGAATPADIHEVSAMGYKIIDWSVDTRDWAGTPTAQIMNYVKREFKPGGIILQHCAGGKGEDLSNTVAALKDIISTLKAQGYSFVTIPQLLGISASK